MAKAFRRFRDFYGNSAYLRSAKSGGCRLTIYVGAKLIHFKTYKSERGARIAMGRLSEGWNEI